MVAFFRHNPVHIVIPRFNMVQDIDAMFLSAELDKEVFIRYTNMYNSLVITKQKDIL